MSSTVSERVGTVGRSDAIVVTVHLLARIAGVVAIAIGCAVRGGGANLSDALTRWDGTYYGLIATGGYVGILPLRPDGSVDQNSTAFFPLYPLLVSGPVRLGVPFVIAALLISWAFGALAAALIARLVATYTTPAIGLASAVLWSVQPAAHVLTLSYSEPLFCALAVGALLAAQRRRWWVAALLAALASATRPSGAVLAIVFAVVAIVAIWRGRRSEAWRAAVAALIAPLGALAYFAYLAVHTDRVDAWFVTERSGWAVHFDGGWSVAHDMAHYVLHPTARPPATGLTVLIAAMLLALLWALIDRPPLAITAYSAALGILAVSSANAYTSIPRFLLPVFALIVPLARRLPNRASLWIAALASGATMCAIGTFSALGSTYPP